jgi:FAD/FMN-containing dehydrogenase
MGLSMMPMLARRSSYIAMTLLGDPTSLVSRSNWLACDLRDTERVAEQLIAAVEWENWEAWTDKHETCYVESKRSVPCGQGRVSLYSVTAQSTADIQAAVRFAKEHNLRIAIRNTGHDFAGRSSAPESLQINTHQMTSKKYVKNFFPAGSKSKKGEGQAVTLGAGVQLYDMYSWLHKHDIMVVGGSSHNVGVSGGYIQGGGHSILGAYKGMASDNALEFTIVTADVRHSLGSEPVD